ncbi:bifunctional DNA primase/polymerase [Streptomyces spongiicola]|uniref:DNA primase n=1 Tax=Streptomyces spongiicola TaxID=1690221 RepID=A0ABN5KT68_9ACTN|nr:bifunctional DNA primase/polymerase [Streptomyces spongiicola]AWK09728.1 DNA primase [Streptomyces spongiicola]
MEDTIEGSIGLTEAAQIPAQRGTQLLDSAVRYVEERHWEVFPGTWLEAVEGGERCSCGASECDAPGAHAVRPDWSSQATGSSTAARRLWGSRPKASVLLPTGRTFDALEVPESAGFLALARIERMGTALGPVMCGPDRRMLFLVLPGAAAKLPELVRGLGRTPGSLDLVARGDGQYVAAPPTRVGGRGAVQWVRKPTSVNRWLPDAEELLSALAYACGREAAVGRSRRS